MARARREGRGLKMRSTLVCLFFFVCVWLGGTANFAVILVVVMKPLRRMWCPSGGTLCLYRLGETGGAGGSRRVAKSRS